MNVEKMRRQSERAQDDSRTTLTAVLSVRRSQAFNDAVRGLNRSLTLSGSEVSRALAGFRVSS